MDEKVRASIALYNSFSSWGGTLLSNRAIGLRKVDHYECYDSFDWEVQCLSKPSSSFRFPAPASGVRISVCPCITGSLIGPFLPPLDECLPRPVGLAVYWIRNLRVAQ